MKRHDLSALALLVPVSLIAAATSSGCATEEVGSSEAFDTEITAPRRFAPDQIEAEENEAIWSQYCIGDAAVTVRPMPNYDDPLVMEAAYKLGQIAEHSFAIYGDINSHHKTDLPEELEGTVTEDAHKFLGFLCGEFRDRATMVEAKLRWVAEMNYLDDEGEADYDPAGDPWKQMRQSDYEPYLKLSNALWNAKRSRLTDEGRRKMMVGSVEVDTPVPAQTVCETKYMFAEYLRAGRSFDDLETFEAGYPAFREASCAPEDEDYFYDFRGDSNIKPSSPESNGMIWFSRTVARQCDSRKAAEDYRQARPEASLSDAECRRYFKYPFTSRFNAARAGLAAWVLADLDQDGLDSNSQLDVVPQSVEDPSYHFGDEAPFLALGQGEEPVRLVDGYQQFWFYGGLGMADLHEGNKESVLKALQLAVDRHTDWYDSGFQPQLEGKVYDNHKAYSPFVASSYEMSKSDHFVTPGTTVPVYDPSTREHKHFMFVFRVHRDHWFTPESINASELPYADFDRVWIDETSFGETGLANSERAWDRLGTPMESELDAVLYLHNIAP